MGIPLPAANPLSSVAYATQEILLILTLGGLAFLHLAPWVRLAVVVLLAVVVISYRQVVRAYPSGGGSYEVASHNLGRSAGLVVAAALLVDYIMTVAVSVAAGVDNVISAVPEIISAVPELNPLPGGDQPRVHRVPDGMNVRGVRESGWTFAVPAYAVVVGVLAMIAVGLIRTAVGDPPVAESAGYDIRPEQVGLSTSLWRCWCCARSPPAVPR